mmetsp:Transcript_35437/g.47851  ORF Transcript_35437/g.47851 Transcript_35437/m.47851 type:complete len:147 (-) Transcript_35437:64-504(-)
MIVVSREISESGLTRRWKYLQLNNHTTRVTHIRASAQQPHDPDQSPGAVDREERDHHPMDQLSLSSKPGSHQSQDSDDSKPITITTTNTTTTMPSRKSQPLVPEEGESANIKSAGQERLFVWRGQIALGLAILLPVIVGVWWTQLS